jgi:hypothetical protein
VKSPAKPAPGGTGAQGLLAPSDAKHLIEFISMNETSA